MSVHLTEHETNRRKAWVDFFIGSQQQLRIVKPEKRMEMAAIRADEMLIEYDKRFKCPYSMRGGDW